MFTFLKAMKAYKNGDPNGINRARSLLNLEELNIDTRESSGNLAAKNLINTLDRIEKVDVLKIPKNPSAKKVDL